MVTIEEISQFLEHPFFLLLAGAGVSSVLIPWFTNRWQDHRKKLEIRADIASKMSEVIAYQMADAAVSMGRKKKSVTDADKATRDENFRKWYVDANIVGSKLESYFSEVGIRRKWEIYCSILVQYSSASRVFFYEALSEEDKDALKHDLKMMRTYFESVYEDKQPIDWDLFTTKMGFDEHWYDVGEVLMRRGYEIIKDVLKLPIKAF